MHPSFIPVLRFQMTVAPHDLDASEKREVAHDAAAAATDDAHDDLEDGGDDDGGDNDCVHPDEDVLPDVHENAAAVAIVTSRLQDV